ncbi:MULTISPECIES: hypothetical protein [Sinorhizobium]|uniref:hypothetical protein n=1 Tax=Sinorhizobium sp. FG01 TaxID=1538168 RepID=UPI001F17FC27|nr:MULTISPECIES: hypothetical protein [Sinorhizobium]
MFQTGATSIAARSSSSPKARTRYHAAVDRLLEREDGTAQVTDGGKAAQECPFRFGRGGGEHEAWIASRYDRQGNCGIQRVQCASIMPGIRTRSPQSITIASNGGALFVASVALDQDLNPGPQRSDLPSNNRILLKRTLEAGPWAKDGSGIIPVTAAAPAQARKLLRENSSKRRDACCKTGLKQPQPVPCTRY